MTSLLDLIGPNVSPAPETVGYYAQVKRWVMGGNDQPNTGDCALVLCANVVDVITTVIDGPDQAEVMDDGEVENAYSRIVGWSPLRPETDHGARLADVFEFWKTQGWPSDPEYKLINYCEITTAEIGQAIYSLGAVGGWAMLPMVDGDWCFDDRALEQDVGGTGAHAMAIVGARPGFLRVVTWTREFEVSLAWWTRYGKQQFGLALPRWIVPTVQAPRISPNA